MSFSRSSRNNRLLHSCFGFPRASPRRTHRSAGLADREPDLVIGTAQGRPVSERNLRRALESAKKAAKLDGHEDRLSWHSLRHSFASTLATDLALPATTLAELIGHADAGFTLRVYARDGRDTAAVVRDVLARASTAGVGAWGSPNGTQSRSCESRFATYSHPCFSRAFRARATQEPEQI